MKWKQALLSSAPPLLLLLAATQAAAQSPARADGTTSGLDGTIPSTSRPTEPATTTPGTSAGGETIPDGLIGGRAHGIGADVPQDALAPSNDRRPGTDQRGGPPNSSPDSVGGNTPPHP